LVCGGGGEKKKRFAGERFITGERKLGAAARYLSPAAGAGKGQPLLERKSRKRKPQREGKWGND